MIDYNQRLIKQLKNITRHAESEKEFSRSTQARWNRKINEAFDILGIDKFKYLDKKTDKAKQQALIKAANTLTKKVETYNKKVEKEVVRTKKTLLKQAKENIKNTDVNKRTLNKMAGTDLLPELQDINNMKYDELHEAIKTMNIPIEKRASEFVENYAQEYFDRYFKNIAEEIGVQKRIDKIAKHFGYDYVKLRDTMERTMSESFKGGYGDTDEMIRNNSDASHVQEMFDRLFRLEMELFPDDER